MKKNDFLKKFDVQKNNTKIKTTNSDKIKCKES